MFALKNTEYPMDNCLFKYTNQKINARFFFTDLMFQQPKGTL